MHSHSDSTTKNSSSSISLYSAETNHSQTSEKSINLNDPAVYRPTPKGIPLKLIFQQATCQGWLTKHQAPTFSFMKTQKKRYVVLVDRLLYTFKSETPDSYREFLEINKHTHAFATDLFSGLYCIEIKKVSPSETVSWYLQAEDAETMKVWLSNIRSTIAWLVDDEQGAYTKDTIRKKSIASSVLTTSSSDTKSDSHYYGNNNNNNINHHHHHRPYRVPSVLPPQLPPPKSMPPPIPSENYF
ncbi:hypothetical protein K501DRAFT_257588 [Backusella circina FSU 941]|nr:hypothetical protein K501DRAFT_257588 [Backusella circina FSU 941]